MPSTFETGIGIFFRSLHFHRIQVQTLSMSPHVNITNTTGVQIVWFWLLNTPNYNVYPRLWHDFAKTLKYLWNNFYTTFTQLLRNFYSSLTHLWHNYDTTFTQLYTKLWHNFDIALTHFLHLDTIMIQLAYNFETTLGQLWVTIWLFIYLTIYLFSDYLTIYFFDYFLFSDYLRSITLPCGCVVDHSCSRSFAFQFPLSLEKPSQDWPKIDHVIPVIKTKQKGNIRIGLISHHRKTISNLSWFSKKYRTLLSWARVV